MAAPGSMKRAGLGEILVEIGALAPEKVAAAGGEGADLKRRLAELGASESALLKAEGLRLGAPYFASLEGLLEPRVAALVPEAMARRRLAVPLFRAEDSLMVGMVQPSSIEAVDELSSHAGLRIVPVLIAHATLFDAIETLYRPKSGGAENGAAAPARAEAGSVIERVSLLLQESVSRRASDMHLEPMETELRSRFRVDGVLQEGKSYPKELETALVARIKILAKLDITETRLPQDGQLRFEYGGKKIDVRVSTLPTIYGEKVVMRVLDASKNVKKLDELGLAERNLKSFQSAIAKPNGIVLVTGPTGSGKTTTLYAALCALNDSERNIVTLEDPVEYRVRGLNQVQIHSKIGLTFAAGLRSILRQDPDVVLLGEIRDQETAETAMRAALTGHLVFSTLHTNDAVSSVHRLADMGVEPFLIAASLNGVMAQRLVRKLCERCARPHEPTAAEREALGAFLPAGAAWREGAGCEACFGLGYAGRFPIHEWFKITREIREMIVGRASLDALWASAKKDGMKTLQEDALAKAALGWTSLSEVIRATREEED